MLSFRLTSVPGIPSAVHPLALSALAVPTAAVLSYKSIHHNRMDAVTLPTAGTKSYTATRNTCANSLPVSLLLAVDTNLTEEHGGEEANVPGDHVQPEWRVQGWAGWEVGELSANLCGEGTEQGGATEGSHRDCGGHCPSAHQHTSCQFFMV